METTKSNRLNKIKDETKRIEGETKRQLLTYIISALGFIVGLSWNEAIKAIIETIYPLDRNSLLAKIIYAITITIVVVFITLFLARTLKDKDEDSKK